MEQEYPYDRTREERTGSIFLGTMINGLQSLTLTQWNQAFSNPLVALSWHGSAGSNHFWCKFDDCRYRGLDCYSAQMFIGACFLVGSGQTFAAAIVPLAAELAYPSHLGQITSLYNALWHLGSVMFAFQNNWTWRIPSALLETEGRALQVLLAITRTAMRHAQDPLVRHGLEEIKAVIAFDREVAGNLGWLSLIKTPENRKRLRFAIAVFSQWPWNGLMLCLLYEPKNAVATCRARTNNAVVAFIFLFYISRNVRISNWCIFFILAESKQYQIVFPPFLASIPYRKFAVPASCQGLYGGQLHDDPISDLQPVWSNFFVRLMVHSHSQICQPHRPSSLLKSRQRNLEETAAIFDDEEGMTQIHDKAAAYAGLTYLSAQEKDTKSDFKMQTVTMTD
ncbi:hypothetical protein BDR05DRAFT_949929 [Suillus weaverae]|nr:hypothetical protein BDR05DRAFT_949929 [Suillus weaverae]